MKVKGGRKRVKEAAQVETKTLSKMVEQRQSMFWNR